jgi:hypothetical protein
LVSGTLPETDDPYVLLGIPRDADRRAVKRAHAQLIKRHRPDRDAEGFKRVQMAYEEILRRLKMRERFAGLTLVVDADGSEELSDPERKSDGGVSSEPPQSRTSSPSMWPVHPTDEFLGSPVEWILQGLRSGRPLSADALDPLAPGELAQLAVHDEASWPSLATANADGLRHGLHRVRVEQLVLRGRVSQALDEAAHPRTRADALSDPALERQLWMIAAAALWDAPDRATALASALGPGTGVVEEDTEPRAVFEDVKRILTAWDHLVRHHPAPVALAAYVRYSRFASYAATETLLAKMRAELDGERERVLAFLDELASRSQTLAEFIHTSIAVDAVDSLSRHGGDQVDAALDGCEAELRTHPAVRGARLTPALVAALVGFAASAGGWTWLVPMLGGPAIVVRARRRAADTYLDVRRRLLDIALNDGIPAAVAGARASADSTRFPTLSRWVDQVDTDGGLLLATELAAIADQWSSDD